MRIQNHPAFTRYVGALLLTFGGGLVACGDDDGASPSYCGDNVVDPGELCDDGNNLGGDGCSPDCQSDETCGNGTTDSAAGELCDDGNVADADGCSATCILEYCGNGITDDGETCDDGNNLSGDGCSGDCASDETCGNSIVDVAAGEGCDDGNTVDDDGCRNTCALPSCGDSMLDPLERCDDGNTVDGDGCSANCASDESCGNSIVDSAVGEECDDGDFLPGDGCGPQCTLEVCGNGTIDASEVCDDGNTADGDSCSAACTEVCGAAEFNLTGGWGFYTEAPTSSHPAVLFGETVFGTDGNQVPPYPTSEFENSFAETPVFVMRSSITFDSWNVDEGTGVDTKRILLSLDGGASWPIVLVDCDVDPTPAFCTFVDADRAFDDWDPIVIDTSATGGATGMLRFEYNTQDTCCGFEQGWFIKNLNVGCW